MAIARDQIIEGIFEDFASFRRVMMSRSEHTSHGLPRAQLEVLFLVAHKGSLRIKDLAESMKVTGSAATQIVEALVQDGSLARTTDQADRRIVRIKLTPRGREQISSAKQAALTHLRGILEQLEESDLATLRQLLKKIIAAN